MSLAATNGTLGAGGAGSGTVSINSNANGLGVGAYVDSVTFTNLTSGNGTTSRDVALAVYAPAGLDVAPANGLTMMGPHGGPFSPLSQNYILTNSGGTTLTWTASKIA